MSEIEFGLLVIIILLGVICLQLDGLAPGSSGPPWADLARGGGALARPLPPPVDEVEAFRAQSPHGKGHLQ